MALKVTLCVYSPDEEQQMFVGAFLGSWGECSVAMDSASLYPFAVSVDVLWDFTNSILYQIFEFAAESDLEIEVEVYSAGDEFNVHALAGGGEEQGVVFEYVLNSQDFLLELSATDKLLLLLNLEMASSVTDALVAEVISNGTEGLSQVQKFIHGGFSYGSDHILAELTDSQLSKLQGATELRSVAFFLNR